MIEVSSQLGVTWKILGILFGWSLTEVSFTEDYGRELVI